MSDNKESAPDFLIVEYREAANAYFKGVDIGYTGFRSFITINGLFAALMGALDTKVSSIAAASEIIGLVPYIAITASVAFSAVLPHYFKHLENCRHRCEEIERIKGGLMFTRLGEIANKKHKFSAVPVLILIVAPIISFWVYFALKMHNPSMSLGKIFS
jgi:hypothetical protein